MGQGDGWSCVTPRCAVSSIRGAVLVGRRSTSVRWRASTRPAESSCACGASRTFRLAVAAPGGVRHDPGCPNGCLRSRRARRATPHHAVRARGAEVRPPPGARSSLWSSWSLHSLRDHTSSPASHPGPSARTRLGRGQGAYPSVALDQTSPWVPQSSHARLTSGHPFRGMPVRLRCGSLRPRPRHRCPTPSWQRSRQVNRCALTRAARSTSS